MPIHVDEMLREGAFSFESSFWLSPSGELIPTHGEAHEYAILENPEMFGLTHKQVEPYFDSDYFEANSALPLAFKKGWVRVIRGSSYVAFESRRIDNQTLGRLQDTVMGDWDSYKGISRVSWEGEEDHNALRGIPMQDFVSVSGVRDLGRVRAARKKQAVGKGTFWLSPYGEMISTEGEGHEYYVVQNPRIFGLSEEDVEPFEDPEYFEYNSVLSLVLPDGWIRIAKGYRDYDFQTEKMDNRTLGRIQDFLMTLMQQGESVSSVTWEAEYGKRNLFDISGDEFISAGSVNDLGRIKRAFRKQAQDQPQPAVQQTLKTQQEQLQRLTSDLGELQNQVSQTQGLPTEMDQVKQQAGQMQQQIQQMGQGLAQTQQQAQPPGYAQTAYQMAYQPKPAQAKLRVQAEQLRSWAEKAVVIGKFASDGHIVGAKVMPVILPVKGANLRMLKRSFNKALAAFPQSIVVNHGGEIHRLYLTGVSIASCRGGCAVKFAVAASAPVPLAGGPERGAHPPLRAVNRKEAVASYFNYWIGPRGEVESLESEEHGSFVSEFPEQFGLSEDEIDEAQNSRDYFDNFLIAAIRHGWIRVAVGADFNFESRKVDTSTLGRIQDFLLDGYGMGSGKRIYWDGLGFDGQQGKSIASDYATFVSASEIGEL